MQIDADIKIEGMCNDCKAEIKKNKCTRCGKEIKKEHSSEINKGFDEQRFKALAEDV